MYYTRDQIIPSIDLPTAIDLIEEGFALYSQGKTVVPPFGSLHFDHGEAHIKYGYIKDAEHYVVKIASNFSSSQGTMLLFSALTGTLQAVLNDEGYLTDLRTAAAGAVAARHLAPKQIRCIGIVGTGTQALFQLRLLQHVTNCRRVMVWGRSDKSLQAYTQHPDLSSFQITPTQDISQLTKACNLIVTTTPSSTPLLFASQIQSGTHITAVGADDLGKQELEPALFRNADLIAVDSREQCFAVGDCSHALKSGDLKKEKVHELGEIILNPALRRAHDQQITLADLTGVAIQDIQIATAVYRSLA
ncbi:MAG: deaminase [Parachlamydia sp.]|nr:deaminase [Parachlamydia sp.]